MCENKDDHPAQEIAAVKTAEQILNDAYIYVSDDRPKHSRLQNLNCIIPDEGKDYLPEDRDWFAG